MTSSRSGKNIPSETLEGFRRVWPASHEGSEAITVALNSMIGEATLPSAPELESVILGMPHRGRLATLVVLNDYPFRNLLYKAAGANDIPVEIDDRVDDMPTHIAVSNSKRF